MVSLPNNVYKYCTLIRRSLINKYCSAGSAMLKTCGDKSKKDGKFGARLLNKERI